MGKAAVFVDRDDTLMVDVSYCNDPEKVELLPLAAEGLSLLSGAGFVIVVVTNQSGLGRGYFTEKDLQEVNERLRAELRALGADYDALYYCPHKPDDGCNCRKPSPGLILRAASEQDLDLASSYTIGDREWDIEAGKAAGTRTVLITNGTTSRSPDRVGADIVAGNLMEAAGLILAHGREEV